MWLGTRLMKECGNVLAAHRRWKHEKGHGVPCPYEEKTETTRGQ